MGGDLHVVIGESNQALDYSIAESLYLYGDDVTVDFVGATADDDLAFQAAASYIYGDVTNLTLNFVNDGLYSVANDDTEDQYASIYAGSDDDEMANLESVTLTGEGMQSAEVYNYQGSVLTTVDATAYALEAVMDGDTQYNLTDSYQDDYYGDADDYYSSFYYEDYNGAVATTVKLNINQEQISNDYLYFGDDSAVAGSNLDNTDVITGFDITNDFIDYNEEGFVFAGVTGGLGEDAVVNESLSLRANLETMASVDVDVDIDFGLVFEYKGSTYLYFDNAFDNGSGTEYNTVTDNDFLVKLTGVTGADGDSTFFFNYDLS